MSEDIQSVMSEPPGGDNHGRSASTDPENEGQHVPLSTEGQQAAELMREVEGFGIVETGRGSGRTGATYGDLDAGMTSHRGTLHPDEYVDSDVLRAAAEDAFGFTYEEVISAYKSGRPTPEQRQLREKIDTRLLALVRSGAAINTMAAVLGMNEKTIDRALTRARDVEVSPIITNPAVTTPTISFVSGEPGAVTRKRRFSKSPKHLVGTINLTEEEFARGFETKPGNPNYWRFRDSSYVPQGGVSGRIRERDEGFDVWNGYHEPHTQNDGLEDRYDEESSA